MRVRVASGASIPAGICALHSCLRGRRSCCSPWGAECARRDRHSRRGGSMGYWLGVDLGTTRTAAALRTGDRVQVATLGSRTAEVPSAIYFAPDGTVLVGEAAVRRGAADPARLVTEFKRRIGDPVPLYV